MEVIQLISTNLELGLEILLNFRIFFLNTHRHKHIKMHKRGSNRNNFFYKIFLMKLANKRNQLMN